MFKKSGRKLLSVLITLTIVISVMLAMTLTVSAEAVNLSTFPQINGNDLGSPYGSSNNGDMKLTVYGTVDGTGPYADFSHERGDLYIGDIEELTGADYATFEKLDGSPFSATSIKIKPVDSAGIIEIYGLDASGNPIGNGFTTTSSIEAGNTKDIDLAADGDFTSISKLKIVVAGTGYSVCELDIIAAPSYNAPTLTVTGRTPTFVENGSPVDLFSGVTAATNDSSQTFSGMTLTVSSVTDTKEYLSIGGTDVELVNGKSGTISGIDNYSVAVASNTATVTVSGMTLSDAQMGTLIDGITYKNTSEDPSTASRAIKITNITDSGSSSNSASPNITSTVSLTAVNDAPTFTTNTGITVNEGSNDNALAKGNLEITDVDTAASSITYTLTAVPTNGTLKKSGTALNTTTNRTFTQDDINNNRLTYTHDGSETTSDSFKFTVSDGAGGSIVETTFAIMVSPVNDLPTITNSTKNGTEDTTLTFAATDFTGHYNDAESAALSEIEIVTLPSALHGILKLDGNNITVGQKIAAANLTKITFEPVANFTGNANFTWKASDGTGYSSAAATMTVAMAGVNDAPNITSGDTANFAENGIGIVYTATRTDSDTGDTVTWSLGGADKDIFSIDSDGKVTFKTAPNYEDKKDVGTDNVYNITVTATDGGGLTASKGVAITVTNVNEAPTITSGTTASVAENQTSTGYTAAGSDEDGGSITWSIIGGADSAKFSISAGGVLTFNSAPNYDIPADVGANNTYEVIIQASDGSIAATKTVTVTITNVNEAPTVTSGATADFAENGTDPVYTATRTDPDTGDTVTWNLGGADKDIFSIDSDGKVTFKTAPNYEDKKDVGTDNVYNITVTATDGGGLTASKGVAITVTNVNEAPTITSGTTASVAENQTSTGYTAAGSDEDGGSITWSIIGGADSAKFSISAGGVLTFNSAPNYDIPADVGANNTYEVIIQASDGSIAATKTVTVTITNVNEVPTVTSGATADFSENGTDPVYTATRTDPDAGDTVTWSLGGVDKDIFSIDSDGKVNFKTAPNYEDKKDAGADNVYNITVTATDGGGLTASKDVAITVTNVDETPTITTSASVSVTEGSTSAFTAAATDPEGSSITWSITGGADAGKFSIVPSTGVVTFTAAPSYSAPADADTHNDYVLEITANDGTLSSAKTVTVTVTQRVSGGGGSTTPTQPSGTGVEILVNGKTETAATATTTQEGNQTVTTIAVDDKKVEEKLQAEGNNATVTIPVNNNSDVVVGQLNGQTVKNMETKEAVLEIKTENVTYTLPAAQINIDNVSDQIGQHVELKDIKVNVTISAPPQDTVKVVEDTANKNNYQLVVKPVEFNITCSSGNKTVEVSKFNGYVDRMVAIPDGIDPNKITTGIVLNSDGTFSHVPTVITKINGKYYAKINSLTNSTYSVIWSPKTFKDVENHWAKDAVNDMGSRLVISGVGDEMFAPDRDITRAEFAAIVVRGLGLMHPGTGKASFSDVSKNDWYYDAVSIAYEYGIISGYGNGKFGPMDKITHEQAMAMVAQAMKITKLKADFKSGEAEQLVASYGDFKNASSWSKNSVALCIKTGVLPDGSGKIAAPKDNITRAEVAVIVQRLLKKSGLI